MFDGDGQLVQMEYSIACNGALGAEMHLGTSNLESQDVSGDGTIQEDEILSTDVVYTIVGGKIAFDRTASHP